jgi:valyl-tRNA synthetase
MPFITEEIWQLLAERKDGESIMVSRLPDIKKHKKEIIERFEIIKQVVSSVRTIRKERELPLREKIDLIIRAESENSDNEFLPVVVKLCNLGEIRFSDTKPDGAASFLTGTTEYHIPLGDKLDKEAELEKIESELIYYRGFLESVMKKLSNERFVQNAPANVIDLEMKKKADAESKLNTLEERKREIEAL